MSQDAGINLIRARYGLAAALARHLRISPSTISEWRVVPVHHLREISLFTGIPREELRPDVFQPLERTEKND
jgi:DNA-binding transcriptional regulator YdaS (Cro superfamily)